MKDSEIGRIQTELMSLYPDCNIVLSEDKNEIVAEISAGFAVAVIEQSEPHFHVKMKEVYKVLRGIMHLACGGSGYVLCKGESFSIDPGLIHHVRAADDPVWIEVQTDPPWSPDDHFIL